MIEREIRCKDMPSIIKLISAFLKRDAVLVGLLTLALIIGATSWSCPDSLRVHTPLTHNSFDLLKID